MKADFCGFIDNWLKKHERSIRWLSFKVHCSDSYLGAVIKGKANASQKLIKNLAHAMHVPVVQLYLLADILTEDDLIEYANTKLKMVAENTEPYEILKKLKGSSSLGGRGLDL